MFRRQAYFAVISFIVLCAAISFAHYALGISFSPAIQPSTIQPIESKPPFWFALFLLILSLFILITALFIFYISWFQDADKIRANIQYVSEQMRLSNFHLRHDYTNINSNAFLRQVRFLSPIMVLLGLVLLLAALNAF
jgi:hypothetical protein